jgi:hypothetical protein
MNKQLIAFEEFLTWSKGKTFNEILGCAKYAVNKMSLLHDVDECDNNVMGFTISYNGKNDVTIEIYVEFKNELIFTLKNNNNDIAFVIDNTYKPMNKTTDVLKNEIVNEIMKNFNNSSVFEKILKAYNRVETDERDGVDYLFNLNNQEDLLTLVRGGMTAKEIYELQKNATETTYFFFGCNYKSPKCLTYNQVISQLKNSLDDIVKFMFAYPFVEEYRQLYVEFVTEKFLE